MFFVQRTPLLGVLLCLKLCLYRKNFTKGYSDIQAKVREATANEDWGPTMGQLEEIARASFSP